MNNLVANRAYTQWMVVAPIIQVRICHKEWTIFIIILDITDIKWTIQYKIIAIIGKTK